MGIDFTSFKVYRLRYWIGYGLVGLLLISVLLFAGLYTPGGISDREISAVIKTDGIDLTNLDSLAITNLPFHLLQMASINLFGVSDFSIKLPSLILAFISAIGLILLLQRWFKPRIALLASIIAISTGQFIFIAQNGTPSILYVLWSVLLMLLGTLIAKRVKYRILWKVLFFVVAALSLYTPLSIYALIALAIATFLHPHLRFILRQLSKPRLAGAILLGIIIALPLLIGIFHKPDVGLNILGIPPTMPDLWANLVTLSQQYFGFATQSTTNLITPVFGLGSMLIIGFGIYKLIRTRESTQSYLIIIWIACLIPILIINPSYTSVTFLPLVLLLATGLESLLGYWYQLFPVNPYARLAGMIPLIVLVGALVLSGLERHFYGYHYDPYTMANFSKDLALLPNDTKLLIVPSEQEDFYQVVAKHRKGLTIGTSPSGESFTTTRETKGQFPYTKISQIITSSASENADRFYVYKSTR